MFTSLNRGDRRLSDEQQAVLLLAQAPKSVFYFVRSFLPGAGATFAAFFLSHRPCETGWNLGPLAEVLAPRQMSPQATKYKETLRAYMPSPQSCSAL